MNRQLKRDGFSLTEVLVVVAILAVLISILLPSLLDSRESARRLVCATQQGSIMTATMIYVKDNDGFFPPAFYNNDGEDNILNCGKMWRTRSEAVDHDSSGFDLLIRDELVEPKTFHCPSDEFVVDNTSAPYMSSYGLNIKLYENNAPNWGGEIFNRRNLGRGSKGNEGGYYNGDRDRGQDYGPRLREIADPADTVFLADKTHKSNASSNSPMFNPAYGQYPLHAINRHPGWIVAGMCDGSVFVDSFEKFYVGVEYVPGWSSEELLGRSIADGGGGFPSGEKNDPGLNYTLDSGLRTTIYIVKPPRVGGIIQQPQRPQ